MDNVRGILKVKVLLTGTLGRDRSRRRRLKNLKTTERRGSGNFKVQRNLKNWKRRSPSRKESLFILFVVFVSTAEIEFEISILRLEFDLETWRQSQNGV